MSYMDRLAGTTRTNAPVVTIASIGHHWAAQDAARTIRERDYADSEDYRTMRSLMNQRTGVCG